MGAQENKMESDDDDEGYDFGSVEQKLHDNIAHF